MSDRAAHLVITQGWASSISDHDTRHSLPELIFGVVTEALSSAGTTMSDVDGVVIAAHDLVDGRSLSSMITGPPAGAYLRDEIRVSDDGLVALSLAAARIESGEASRVVAAWGRASEGDPVRSGRVAFDPWIEQPFALSALGVSAMRASAYLRSHRCTARRSAAAARRDRALANPRGVAAHGRRPDLIYPLGRDEVYTEADVVAAVVWEQPARFGLPASDTAPSPRASASGDCREWSERGRRSPRPIDRRPGIPPTRRSPRSAD